uniref:Transmembrane transport protein n=1 Tax=uncultured Armatimonadetes bacterium TaxID=157466 RepID=A0A6J4K5G2_9BACT|nr:Putative transmembrane transport protein [uncultured Armatimonadetes bacterium]
MPVLVVAASGDVSLVFIELGAAVVGLAVLARLANRWGFSAIPLYLLAGLAFGNGGLLPLDFSQDFVHVGAEIGVILLLFLLGLEYTGEELGANLRTGFPSGVVDFVLNFSPGLLLGLLLGWGPLAAFVLGGVTYISSSGVIAKVLGELGRMNHPETPAILAILVIEDLAMALYLPLVSVLLAGQGLVAGVVSVLVALATVAVVLFAAVRYGRAISRAVSHQSDEIILLTTFGLVLLVAGIAQRLQVSAAVGAFLVGIALSGTIAERAHRLFAPLRDLFAAVFFFFFGLQIDPATLPPVLPLAAGLGVVTAGTKLFTGWWAARRAGLDASAGLRAGAALVARGEFSIVIAGLGVAAGLTPRLGALSAAYVLLLAVLGPVLARAAKGPRAVPAP